MDKSGKIAIIAAVSIVAVLLVGFAFAAPPTKHCKDGIDNDGDGLTDLNDPGCSNKNDASELNFAIACDDGIDNGDADSLTDYNDPGCTGPTDTDETDGACDDGTDNDGDSYTDYPADPGCTSYGDSSELGTVECDDGIDNDGDNATDYNDPGCTGPTDTDETNCGDGVCEGGETQYTCSTDCGSPAWCGDTDGGINQFVYGTISGSDGEDNFTYSDFCIDSSWVFEYYCDGSNPANTNATCYNATCVNGACV